MATISTLDSPDLAPTLQLAKLLYMPTEKWDDKWYEKVADLAWYAPFQTDIRQSFRAADSFFYFGLYFPTSPGFEPYYIGSLIDYFIENRLGLAIGKDSENILAWIDQGSVLGYKLYGSPFFRWKGAWGLPGEVKRLTEAKQVLIAHPNEELFPPLARDYMRYLLKDLYLIEVPKVIAYQVEDEPTELCFNVFPEDFESEEMFRGAMANVVRFLPPPQKHRIIFMNKGYIDEDLFQPF